LIKRLIGIAVSALILWLIWRRIDGHALDAAVRTCDPQWLLLALAGVIPLNLAMAWRFRLLARSSISLWDALRLILSASTLNLVLPSKMGDLAKGWALAQRHAVNGHVAFGIVLLEKTLDLASLLLWGVTALVWIAGDDPWLWAAGGAAAGCLLLLLLLIAPFPAAALMRQASGLLPPRFGRELGAFAGQWEELTGWFWADGQRSAGVIALSVLLWAGHLTQFWLLARALSASVPFIDNMAFATLSILVGLVPFTLGGIGTRDAAIIFFYRAWLLPNQGALLGVLATIRYLIPAIAGLPFLHDYRPARRVTAQ
jgi:glycosyltransferase 2 family protein